MERKQGERPSLSRPDHRRGFTLLELMISMSLILIAFWAFCELLFRTTDANEYALAFSSVCTTAQLAVNDIREDLSVAKLIFRNDSIGQGYWAAVSLPPLYPLLAQSRLPGAREGGVFEKDTATTNYSGNILFFCRTETAYAGDLKYCNDASKTREVYVDMYRIVAYYLMKVPGAQIGRASNSLNLVRVSTDVYADYLQVTTVKDPKESEDPKIKDELLSDLYHNHGIRYVWDTTAAATSAFYALSDTGPGGTIVVASTADPAYHPPFTTSTEFIKNLPAQRESVSWNTSLTGFDTPVAVPRLAYPVTTSDGFPNGFEVQVIGLSGARQTLVGLTLARETSLHRMAAHRAEVVVSSKDYF